MHVFARHEVGRPHRAQRYHITVGAEVPHHADAAHRGQHRKILVRLHTAFRHFLAEDRVRFAQYAELLFRDLAHTAHRKSRSGERLAVYDGFRKSEFTSQRAHLVLEKSAQRLDYADESALLRQSAHVVVALDVRAVVRAALYDVGIYRPLREETIIVFRALALEHADELLADDLSFLFRLGHAGEP